MVTRNRSKGVQVTAHIHRLSWKQEVWLWSRVIILRHSHVDSESGFKEELQKGRIIKIGGLPPMVLSGYVFIRMFKNLVSVLVYPLSVHTRLQAHSFVWVSHREEKQPPRGPPPLLLIFSNFRIFKENTRVAAKNFMFLFPVTTWYRLFTKRKTEAQRRLCYPTASYYELSQEAVYSENK